jgi:hypothetical protein
VLGGRRTDPPDVERMAPAEADRLLDDLEANVPQRPPYVRLPGSGGASAYVFGDTHGDWLSTREAVRAFEAGAPGSLLVGLGDYVDRAPPDLPFGSVANALYLLGLAARSPERVFLLQGNHETVRRIGAHPHTLPEDVERLWGGGPERYARILGLLERGPLVATTASGAYFAHAGFPKGTLPERWQESIAVPSEDRLLELVWAEPDASTIRRGAVAPWTEKDLDRFLGATGLAALWRGHDPDLAGRTLYGGRAMTLHTTRIYQRYGGVLLAVVPLDGTLRSVTDAELRHLAPGTAPARP